MNLSAALGLLLMVVSESATLAHVEPFYSWNTPIAWTGFILFADGVVWAHRKRSWMRSSPREFAFLTVVSIPLWLVFEFYNQFIDNWYYTGLPVNPWLRYFGYAWSFATIWPAIFEAADLIDVWLPGKQLPESRVTDRPVGVGRRSASMELSRSLVLSMVAGAAMLLLPFAWPSRYLAAPVWLGFIFLLEPINLLLGAESVITDLRRSDATRLRNLAASGLLCGVLWESWNFWAGAKWHYTVPIMEHVKIFEMPLPGYLGFPAFAIECFSMYVFLRVVVVRLFPAAAGSLNRAIALS